jgi:hypothetical protein
MTLLIGIALLGAIGMLTVLVPLQLPWRQRVRWLATAVATDPVSQAVAPIDAREALVVDAVSSPDRIVVTLLLPGPSTSGTTATYVAPPGPTTAALLARWRAAGTPLLLLAEGGHTSLHGPHHAVTGLRAADPALRPAARPVTD